VASLLTHAFAAESLYARTIRRLRVCHQPVCCGCICVLSLFLVKTPQVLHDHHPSTFAKIFAKPLVEHVRDFGGDGAHSRIDVSFITCC
jgi:uncharacterized membrane protein YqhA